MFFKKEMYKYNEFDRVKINLSKLPNAKDKLKKYVKMMIIIFINIHQMMFYIIPMC